MFNNLFIIVIFILTVVFKNIIGRIILFVLIINQLLQFENREIYLVYNILKKYFHMLVTKC